MLGTEFSLAALIVYLQRTVTHEWLAKHYPLAAIVDLATFFSLVWLLWYALGIEMGGKGLSVLAAKTGVRRVADVIAMGFGACLLVYADYVTRSVFHQIWVTLVHMLWALAIIGFYGHDLWASFKPARTESASTSPAS